MTRLYFPIALSFTADHTVQSALEAFFPGLGEENSARNSKIRNLIRAVRMIRSLWIAQASTHEVGHGRQALTQIGAGVDGEKGVRKTSGVKWKDRVVIRGWVARAGKFI